MTSNYTSKVDNYTRPTVLHPARPVPTLSIASKGSSASLPNLH